MAFVAMARLSRLMGQAGRLRILELLGTRPRTVDELAGLTGRSRPQLRAFLDELLEEEIVATRPSGAGPAWELSTPTVRTMVACLVALDASTAPGRRHLRLVHDAGPAAGRAELAADAKARVASTKPA